MKYGKRALPDDARVIAAVRDQKQLAAALASPVPVIFLLASEIGTVAEQVQACREQGKEALVHLDLVHGLGRDAAALRWLAASARPTGIITTRAALISPARSLGLLTVLRTFLVDSHSVHVAAEQVRKVAPDYLEVLPGIAPEGIRLLAEMVDCPVIGGGLIRAEIQVKAALAAGAVAVSTSREELWRSRNQLGK